MKHVNLILLALVVFLSTTSCCKSRKIKIAFLADVHLHDIYTSLEGNNIASTPLDKNGRNVTIRPMEDQLHSTRMFNENYFAFIAALDDIVSRDVDYVVLPGDFSDNGQMYNLTALRNILDGYSKNYDIEFFITTGNHDPVRPYSNSDVSLSILDSCGARQIVYGKKRGENSIVSSNVTHGGYAEIVDNLDQFGFMPKPNYIYWETPFNSYSYKEYSVEKAISESKLNQREYRERDNYPSIPDASYLVEPIEGLWILAIDANSYPVKNLTPEKPNNPSNYGSPSEGWNTTIKYKKHLIEWIKSVGARAEAEGKKLIAFSHYPAVDFFNGASSDISQLIGEKKMQLTRNPDSEVAEILADAGISLHFAGHMHIDDIGEYTSKKGNKITNIQVPSIAGYCPGYKLLTLNGDKSSIETITIENVKNFDILFPIYAAEYDYLQKTGSSNVWNRDILEVNTYKEFIEFHLKELVRLRYIPSDWKGVIDEDMLNLTGSELLQIAEINDNNIEEYKDFTLFDIIYDLYRLYNGDSIAVIEIGNKRLEQYKSMLHILQENNHNSKGTTFINILKIINQFSKP